MASSSEMPNEAQVRALQEQMLEMKADYNFLAHQVGRPHLARSVSEV